MASTTSQFLRGSEPNYQRIRDYRNIMHERVSSDTLSRMSVRTPATRMVLFIFNLDNSKPTGIRRKTQ